MSFMQAAKAASVAVDVTAEFTLWSIGRDPEHPWILIVRPAGEPNTAYLDAAFKLPSASRPGSSQMSVTKMHSTAGEYAAIYAKHVIVGWRNVYEDESPDVPAVFTRDKALELLTALIQPPPAGRPDLFVSLRVFCGELENFRSPVVDAAALGKA